MIQRPRARWLLATSGVALAAACSLSGMPGQANAAQSDQLPPTPVFSARRVPALVQSVAVQGTLRAELVKVMAQSPADTCLDVAVDGRGLFEAKADQPFIPASNQKLVTAKLALDLLGENHRYQTKVTGKLGTNGVVSGDLYLVGGGDPVLRTKAYAKYLGAAAGVGTSLEALADAVVAQGVKHITGSVVGDESRYDSQRSVPGWPDRFLDQHQLGPLSALEVDQSFTDFPDTYSEDTLGELVATDNPPLHAAQMFANLLQARGVQIDGTERAGTQPADAATITSISSPPLTAIVAQMLNRSDNQIAELLVKEAGVVKAKRGTTVAGLAAFSGAFVKLGLPDQGVAMHDGSGLGYDNRTTCGFLAALLSQTGPTSAIGRGLAVGGRTGTLKERFEDAATKGRIKAKTGTLDNVSALSGFALPSGAPPVVFSYIANGAAVTPELLDVQEDLGQAFVDYGHGTTLAQLGPR